MAAGAAAGENDAIPRIPDLECTSLEFLLTVQDAQVQKDAAAKLLAKVKEHGSLDSGTTRSFPFYPLLNSPSTRLFNLIKYQMNS